MPKRFGKTGRARIKRLKLIADIRKENEHKPGFLGVAVSMHITGVDFDRHPLLRNFGPCAMFINPPKAES